MSSDPKKRLREKLRQARLNRTGSRAMSQHISRSDDGDSLDSIQKQLFAIQNIKGKKQREKALVAFIRNLCDKGDEVMKAVVNMMGPRIVPMINSVVKKYDPELCQKFHDIMKDSTSSNTAAVIPENVDELKDPEQEMDLQEMNEPSTQKKRKRKRKRKKKKKKKLLEKQKRERISELLTPPVLQTDDASSGVVRKRFGPAQEPDSSSSNPADTSATEERKERQKSLEEIDSELERLRAEYRGYGQCDANQADQDELRVAISKLECKKKEVISCMMGKAEKEESTFVEVDASEYEALKSTESNNDHLFEQVTLSNETPKVRKIFGLS